MHSLLEIDRQLYHWINQHGMPWLDPVMLTASNLHFWWGVAGMVTLSMLLWRNKKMWATWILVLMTIGVCDALSYYVMKEFFRRERPCYQEAGVRMILPSCGGRFGFPSNHAANSMGAATIVAFALGGSWSAIVSAIALIVGLSRVYLGVHYPSDVLVGFAEGAIVGTVMYYLACFIGKKTSCNWLRARLSR